MNYAKSLAVAKAWIQAAEPCREVDEAQTVTRPYGWAFRFRGAAGCGQVIGGPKFIVVDRINGDLKAFGSGAVLEVALAEYEATIPGARLTLNPEFPPTGGNNRGFICIDPTTGIDVTLFPEPLAQYWHMRHPGTN